MVNLQIESLAGSWLTLKCAQIDGTSAKNDGNHLVYPSGFCSSKSFLIKLRLAGSKDQKSWNPKQPEMMVNPVSPIYYVGIRSPLGFTWLCLVGVIRSARAPHVAVLEHQWSRLLHVTHRECILQVSTLQIVGLRGLDDHPQYILYMSGTTAPDHQPTYRVVTNGCPHGPEQPGAVYLVRKPLRQTLTCLFLELAVETQNNVHGKLY